MRSRGSIVAVACVLAACGVGREEQGPSQGSGSAGSTGPDTSSLTSHPAEDDAATSTTADGSESRGGAEESSSGTTGGEPCVNVVPGPSMGRSYPFTLGGQDAWSHDAGSPAGWFHTYDALDVGGPDDAPHEVHLLLPRDYDACGPGYPVVYMNDGDSSFWPGGAANKSWDVPVSLADLYARGVLGPVIVVAVEPVDRDYEYSHVPWTGGLSPAACCGVEQYADYLADGIKGFVDAHYHTRPEPEHTVLVGSSRGGLASFFVANRRPDAFGSAACMSPSFWVGLDPVFGGGFTGGPLATSELVMMLEGTLDDPGVRPRLWIDWGLVFTGGFHNEVIEAAAAARGAEMVELLASSYGYVDGQELYWMEDPQGEHDEWSWGRRFPDVMLALLGSP